MTPVLMAVCLLTGLLVGLRVGARWRRALRRQLAEERSRIDMWNSNALATDHDVIGGPVTPARGTVELFDGARLAEWREQTCPEAGGCRRPEQCVSGCYWRRLDALNQPHTDAVRCADGGVCAYTARGMAACDDECAVVLSDDEQAQEFLDEARLLQRRSPGPVDDDTSDMRSLPHRRVD